ncbi:MAG: glycosyltransferase, partial [Proteobacteria bacterium]|nr:glycosyltransferase [Pseudomonadota bacterium]
NLFFVPVGRVFGHASTIASRRWWKKTARGGLPTLNRWAYRFAHRVLANTESVGRMLIEDEGVPAGKVVEIPNFLRTDAFVTAPAEEVARQRRAWNVPEGAFVVGMVARLAAVKNHAMLMRALAQTAEAVFLVIVGDGPERKALEQQVRDLGLQRRVAFAGERHDGAAQHRYFDVSVLTSVSEGFPNSVIEAMAAARPVVATAVGGVPDVIEHGASGLLVPSEDVPALARAIMDLQRDAALASRLGRAGQALVRRRYHRDVVIEKLHRLYLELALPAAIVPASSALDGDGR